MFSVTVKVSGMMLPCVCRWPRGRTLGARWAQHTGAPAACRNQTTKWPIGGDARQSVVDNKHQCRNRRSQALLQRAFRFAYHPLNIFNMVCEY
jgi:hypothetical protein